MLLFAVLLISSVIIDLNPNLIPFKINKLLSKLFGVMYLTMEFTNLKDYIWNMWKKIPTTIHIVISCFFSFIILKIAPIAMQKIWNEENGKLNLENANQN